ncbi:GNAT family N-acetyltransferase [Sabulibacter ruber]|uniref:GNAT family N-acetyltransferase n=1 Tax=Sabulibacter ruber TaxID=2811901 RepID=UPI001A96F360|nr:GNAT family N-acetyltransferase [Sabulibacter ruber]
MPVSLEIREISAPQTWPLRHQVMWPHKPISFVQLPEDEGGLHFGAFLDQELVSVVSLFIQGDQAQFRKFATLQQYQGQGIGRQLLGHVLSYASSQNLSRVWCHARSSACSFYQKMGMEAEGEPFIKNGLEYVRMVKSL